MCGGEVNCGKAVLDLIAVTAVLNMWRQEEVSLSTHSLLMYTLVTGMIDPKL